MLTKLIEHALTEENSRSLWFKTNGYTNYRAQFHITLIRLKFNPIYFMQKYTYFKQCYQEC